MLCPHTSTFTLEGVRAKGELSWVTTHPQCDFIAQHSTPPHIPSPVLNYSWQSFKIVLAFVMHSLPVSSVICKSQKVSKGQCQSNWTVSVSSVLDDIWASVKRRQCKWLPFDVSSKGVWVLDDVTDGHLSGHSRRQTRCRHCHVCHISLCFLNCLLSSSLTEASLAWPVFCSPSYSDTSLSLSHSNKITCHSKGNISILRLQKTIVK